MHTRDDVCEKESRERKIVTTSCAHLRLYRGSEHLGKRTLLTITRSTNSSGKRTQCVWRLGPGRVIGREKRTSARSFVSPDAMYVDDLSCLVRRCRASFRRINCVAFD